MSDDVRGLAADLSPDRMSFLQSDLSQEYLGLEIQIYRSLLYDVTHIIYNAWDVNFNFPLALSEVPHLIGIR